MKMASLALAVGFLVSCAGMEVLGPDELIYRRIIERPGMSQSDLFDRSHKWIAEAFNSSKAVIEYQSKESGEIIGKGSVDVTYTYKPIRTHFTIHIEVKDGRERVTFKNMHLDTGMGPFNNRLAMDKFTPEAERIADSLESYLSKKSESW